MIHYICNGGCRGVSDHPKTCGAFDCPRHGEPLEECDCADEMHKGAFEQKMSGQSEKGRGEAL